MIVATVLLSAVSGYVERLSCGSATMVGNEFKERSIHVAQRCAALGPIETDFDLRRVNKQAARWIDRGALRCSSFGEW